VRERDSEMVRKREEEQDREREGVEIHTERERRGETVREEEGEGGWLVARRFSDRETRLRRTAAAPFGKKLVSCKIVIDGERRFRRRTFGKKIKVFCFDIDPFVRPGDVLA